MALNAQQTQQVIRTLVGAADPAPFNFSRADITAAVAAVDAWATANAASYNSALPEPFKSGANASLKALVLAYVCLRRAGL